MSSSYKEKIYDIAVNTLEITCYMFPLEEWEVEEGKDSWDKNIHSVVGFHGAAKGEMMISPSDELLAAMAKNMLGTENPDAGQKEESLCEIANIICGNTVPLFANNDHICYIEPPRIIRSDSGFFPNEQEVDEELVRVHLDEGAVDIAVYYTMEDKL